MLLGECGREELALGLVGKFWAPGDRVRGTRGIGTFADLSEPGWAKTVYDLQLKRIDDAHTLLTGTMRTATTDDRARRWFRRCWTLGVGAGAHVLVDGLLDPRR